LLVQSANPAATPYIYLTAGEQRDSARTGPEFWPHFSNTADSPMEFHTRPGDHDPEQWNSQLPWLLREPVALI